MPYPVARGHSSDRREIMVLCPVHHCKLEIDDFAVSSSATRSRPACLKTDGRPDHHARVAHAQRVGEPNTYDRTVVALEIRRSVGPRYWPRAVFLYPALAIVTFGIALWVIRARQEERIGTPRGRAWWNGFAFTYLMSLIPLGAIIVAASYGRNLWYISQPTGRAMLSSFGLPITPPRSPTGISAGEWLADPTGQFDFRFRGPNGWTEHVSEYGRLSTDPEGVEAARTASGPETS